MYDVGDRARLTFSLTDTAGAPANGTVVLTVTDPTGVTSTPAVTNPATGSYTADVDLDQAGRWTYRWVSTGAVVAAQTDVLNVVASAPLGIVSLADVKAHLNITSTGNDDELRHYIAAATDFVESRIGPVVRRTLVETVQPQSGRLFLSAPVIEVTSLAGAYGYSGAYTVGNWAIDGASLVANYGVSTYCWPVTVTYVGGRTIVPATVQHAALDYVKWLWESQRGSTPLPLPGGEFETVTPATVPYRILQALEPYAMPVVA